MCSKHVEAWSKLIIKSSASSWFILINKYIEIYGQQNIKKKNILQVLKNHVRIEQYQTHITKSLNDTQWLILKLKRFFSFWTNLQFIPVLCLMPNVRWKITFKLTSLKLRGSAIISTSCQRRYNGVICNDKNTYWLLKGDKYTYHFWWTHSTLDSIDRLIKNDSIFCVNM